MPEGSSEIPIKDIKSEPKQIDRRTFLKGAAVIGTAVVVESTIGKIIPAEASSETPNSEKNNSTETQKPPTQEQVKVSAKERTPEQKANDAKAACENLLVQIRKIDNKIASMVADTSFSQAVKWLEGGNYAEAQRTFERISNSFLAVAAANLLNEEQKKHPGKSYSWFDIRGGMDKVMDTRDQPLSELRNYFAEKTLIDTKIVRYFWRGIPKEKTDKQGKPQEIVLYTSPTYSEDLNEIAAMAGSFSIEKSANAEAIMGGILATPPEKPNRQDITAHLNRQYDWVVMPEESVKGARIDNSSEEEIPDKREWKEKLGDFFSGNKNEVKKAKVLYARASEIIPTY